MNTRRIVTFSDFPDWSRAFDGEASYPLTERFRGPLLTAACWSAWNASQGNTPSANPKDIARLAARALAAIEDTPAEEIIPCGVGIALMLSPQGSGEWFADEAAKALYGALKWCQMADSIGSEQRGAWGSALVLAHVVGAAEAQQ